MSDAAFRTSLVGGLGTPGPHCLRIVFLAMDGQALYVPPPELHALTMRVATDAADDALVAAYLRQRMTPRA
jgi:hypothetical protein